MAHRLVSSELWVDAIVSQRKSTFSPVLRALHDSQYGQVSSVTARTSERGYKAQVWRGGFVQTGGSHTHTHTRVYAVRKCRENVVCLSSAGGAKVERRKPEGQMRSLARLLSRS